ncbi:hypothetical protein EV426DRAFT_612954, partial [Tirmania nivea]
WNFKPLTCFSLFTIILIVKLRNSVMHEKYKHFHLLFSRIVSFYSLDKTLALYTRSSNGLGLRPGRYLLSLVV